LIFKIFILLFSFSAMAFDKDFTAVSERVPLEFGLLFESLKLEVKSPSDKLKMVALCKDLNTNLGSLKKEQIYFLMKSEVIKNTMEYKFAKTRQFDVTTLLIKRLDEGYAKKSKYMNKFSLWIWRSILAELKIRQKTGIITEQSFSARTFDGARLKEALRFEKYLTYLNPWIDRMDSYTAPEFNQLSKEVSWVILRRLNERSILFKRFAASAISDTQVTLFNIPQRLLDLKPSQIKNIENDAPLSYQEQSEVEKASATKTVEKVTPEDMSTISDGLAEELEKKTKP
jgi:hypothetical protein